MRSATNFISQIGEIKGGKQPQDIVARMLQTSFAEGVDFPIERLARNVVGLLIGTIETSCQAVLHSVQGLLRRPEILPQAVTAAEQNDGTFEGYVWETLRFHPVLPYLFRKTASDYVIGRGTDREALIKPGTLVLPLTLSAMFDPSRFTDPDRFDPSRGRRNTFHFGFGIHECLGKYIAAVVVPEMVRQVIRRSGIEAQSPIEYNGRPLPEWYRLRYDA